MIGTESRSGSDRDRVPVAADSDAMIRSVLTPREYEYLRLRALGHTNDEAARHMGIHYQTAKNYLTTANAKLLRPHRSHNIIETLLAVGWLKVPPS